MTFRLSQRRRRWRRKVEQKDQRTDSTREYRLHVKNLLGIHNHQLVLLPQRLDQGSNLLLADDLPHPKQAENRSQSEGGNPEAARVCNSLLIDGGIEPSARSLGEVIAMPKGNKEFLVESADSRRKDPSLSRESAIASALTRSPDAA